MQRIIESIPTHDSNASTRAQRTTMILIFALLSSVRAQTVDDVNALISALKINYVWSGCDSFGFDFTDGVSIDCDLTDRITSLNIRTRDAVGGRLVGPLLARFTSLTSLYVFFF